MKRAAALLLCVACSRGSARPSSEPPAPTTPAPPAAAASSAPPPASPEPPAAPAAPRASVALLDAGLEPRRALRYAFHAERREQMTVELRTAISAQGAGTRAEMPLPPIRLRVALEPERVTPEGDLRYAWHVASAAADDADAGAGAAPELAAGWAAQLAPVQHLAGTGAVTARGLARDVTINPASTGDAGADAPMVVQVVQMLRDYVAAPLPEEPVGKGARWQRLSSLEARGSRAAQTDTYTLVDLDGAQGTLDDTIAQTASPQALPSPPGAPAAPPATLDSLLTSATAKIRFNLGRLVPDTSLVGTTSMSVSAPRSQVSMVMRLGIQVQGTPP